MKSVFTLAVIAVALTCAILSIEHRSTQAQGRTYQLTVRNITERQPISPPIVVIHDSNAVLLPSSADRLDGLEEFAETGEREPTLKLMESLQARSGVKSVKRFGGTIEPKTQQTIFSVNVEPGDHISVLGMLTCTNDGIAMGTAILTDADEPAFGSGVVYDAGTENNAESRKTVPCLQEEGTVSVDTAAGEGSITRHPGIAVIGDLGAVFGWDRTVLEIVVDRQGSQPKPAFDVGATIANKTKGQPITSPVVVVHDKNVDVVLYRRPKELQGIDRLSESGNGSVLLDTFAAMPGVLSVVQWETGGPIAPGKSFRNNVRASIGTTVTILGMFACTNDGYIVASAEVAGFTNQIQNKSAIATVFDSGSENNDETTETVPCLGGDAAGYSEGTGENQRSEHPGISGSANLNPALHGWSADNTATLTVHTKIVATPQPTATPTPQPTATPEPTAEPTATPASTASPEPSVEPTQVPVETPTQTPSDEEDLPDTGGVRIGAMTIIVSTLLGIATLIVGIWLMRLSQRRRASRGR